MEDAMRLGERHSKLASYTADQCLRGLDAFQPELRIMLEEALHLGSSSAVLAGMHEVGKALGPLHQRLLPDGKLALYRLRDLMYRLWNPKNIEIWAHQTDDMWTMYENQMAQDVAALRLGRECCSYADVAVWRGILEELRGIDPTIELPLD